MTCPTCRGHGGHYHRPNYYTPARWTPCPTCHGTEFSNITPPDPHGAPR